MRDLLNLQEKAMNRPIAILAFVFAAGCLSAQSKAKDPVDHYGLEKAADVVIYYCPEGDNRQMKISIGPRKDDEPRKVVREEKFSATSIPLEEFFNDRPRKDLIVIVYEKNKLDDSELNDITISLRNYFVARGYKRIFIRQAIGGGAPFALLEYPKNENAEQDGGGQPTTRPESK